MTKTEPIPHAQLRLGIDKCCEVAGWRLREAETILNGPAAAPNTAAILFSFGVEEFGKAVLLRRALDGSDGDVIIAGFYDHRTKW